MFNLQIIQDETVEPHTERFIMSQLACDGWLTQHQQVDSDDGLSLFGQRRLCVQRAEVIIPPWNIHHLQRDSL